MHRWDTTSHSPEGKLVEPPRRRLTQRRKGKTFVHHAALRDLQEHPTAIMGVQDIGNAASGSVAIHEEMEAALRLPPTPRIYPRAVNDLEVAGAPMDWIPLHRGNMHRSLPRELEGGPHEYGIPPRFCPVDRGPRRSGGIAGGPSWHEDWGGAKTNLDRITGGSRTA